MAEYELVDDRTYPSPGITLGNCFSMRFRKSSRYISKEFVLVSRLVIVVGNGGLGIEKQRSGVGCKEDEREAKKGRELKGGGGESKRKLLG